MTKTPLFSVLVAYYNNFEFFEEFYRSVFNQTYQNFEIVLVDDCSTDHSLEKIREITATDTRVRIFKNEKNEGVGFTKKKCIELAKGEICGFIDPDDAVSKDALQLSIQQFQDRSEIVATYSKIIFCDENLKPLKVFSRTTKVKNGEKYFFNINNEVSHFFTFRRETYFKTVGINENLTSSVDFDLYLKLYEKGDFKYIPKPLYFYRQHRQGVSQDKTKKEKLHQNWRKVLLDTCARRGISNINGLEISANIDIAKVLFEKENTIVKKIQRRIFRLFNA
ncbi:hypothetical protein OA84_00200 [Kaistella solincola]|uniref:Glycosyltransferase 2-like domain-containing protein n=1 Tax=Kaistella solincola TaxID=510955 RepID=A0ABR4ZTH3_9FLAO|nr:glycosyltransferase [Kaistella solincola]KIA84928.1 hypothetical protein OA84_00200 [Kaistella solincola]